MMLFQKRPVYLSGMKAKHVVVISIDALNSRDIPEMEKLSYFSNLMNNGTVAKESVGVYPSLTYPSHVSIITGTYPIKHGITDNKPFTATCKDTPWFFYDRDIRVQTLYGAAYKCGLSTGSFFWPVTAGAKIHYNCPPIWPSCKQDNQILLSLRYGSPWFLLQLEKKFGWLRNGRKYPHLDNFTAISAAYLLRKRQPNLLLVAFSELDHERHRHGRDSLQAKNSLIRTNERLGFIIEAAKDAGIFDHTTFIVLGDHGFLDYKKSTALNRILSDNNYITLNDKQEIVDYIAFAHVAGGSAQIFLKDRNNKKVVQEISDLLLLLRDSRECGVEAVYNHHQALEKGVAGDFSFIVEAEEGYNFISSVKAPPVAVLKGNCNEVATHGYDPDKNDYRTAAIFSGSGIRKNVVLKSINCIDIAPTLSELLNVSLPDSDGRVLEEVLFGL